ncbi:MAG: glycosyltransferase [Pyrinomonadaceae bacterium]|nr:glycosyltransferase [Pyrinomonadaceae bacterium]
MKRILVFCDYYRPSLKAGGGMWTIANLVDRLCDRYEFHIVTRNYDSPGDTRPYTSVRTGEWNDLGNAKVFYAAADDLTAANCARLAVSVDPHVVFLNSVFSTPVVKFLIARRRRMIPNIGVVLAPCGELSSGALQSKSLKKRTFLAIARATGLYSGVIWKASTDLESKEIKSVFGDYLEPIVAPDLTPLTILPEFEIGQKPAKSAGAARFVFLSRIVPKKNLAFALRIFREIKAGDVLFEIVGPIEDAAYWHECEELINELPSNVKVNLVGGVDYNTGLQKLVESHFFILPTLNENFGYVFIESLAAGTPILISDQTVWGSVSENEVGWVSGLGEDQKWIDSINECIEMNDADFVEMAARARKFAVTWLADTEYENATARAIEAAIERNSVL